MSAIVMMLIFYRVHDDLLRRVLPQRQVGVREGTPQQGMRGAIGWKEQLGKRRCVWGFNWLFLIWRKVMDTIKMGTQG